MGWKMESLRPLGATAKQLELGDAANQLTVKVYGQSENRDTESVLMVTVNMGTDPDLSVDYSADANSTVRLMRPGDVFTWPAGVFTAGAPHDVRARNLGNRELRIEAYDS